LNPPLQYTLPDFIFPPSKDNDMTAAHVEKFAELLGKDPALLANLGLEKVGATAATSGVSGPALATIVLNEANELITPMESFREAVRLAPRIFLKASPQKFRWHRLSPFDISPSTESFLEIGDPDVTRQMMAGALYAGLKALDANKNLGDESVTHTAPSLLRYIHSLAASYQTTQTTPPTMRRVAKILTERNQHISASYCLHVAEQEFGHDTLALMDIAALGLPAQEFVARLRPKNSLALVERFSGFADSDEPISVLGYAYVLERMALFSTQASVAEIERLIPAGINATRCLRVHSAVGSDSGHVDESIAFIATLPARSRASIARAVYETSLQVATQPDDYPGDTAMRAIMKELGCNIDEAVRGESVV
jgi:hypothetical protein